VKPRPNRGTARPASQKVVPWSHAQINAASTSHTPGGPQL